MITDIAIVKCPECGRLARIPRLYAPSLKGIKKVAVNHGNHFLVIGFDKYGVVRYFEIFQTLRQVPMISGVPLKCSSCGKTIIIPSAIRYGRFAVDHHDHVLLIYKAGNKYEMEVIDVVKQVLGIPKQNIIRKILKYTSRREMAYILAKIIMDPGKMILVPQNIYDEIKYLIKKLFGKSNNVRVGYIKEKINSIPLDFLETKISEVEDLSDEEAISLLQDTIELITSLRDSIIKIRKLYGIDEACRYLSQLEKTNSSLFKLVNSIIRIKC